MTEPRMTRPEAVMLCRFAKAACPQQQFDEYTPDAWFELLGDLRFVECKDALVEVVKGRPFVSPSEIRDQVKRTRTKRLNEFGLFHPPREIPNLAEWQAWVSDMNRRIADGELTREQWDAQLEAEGLTGRREMPALDSVFRRLEDIDPTAIEVEGDWSEPA